MASDDEMLKSILAEEKARAKKDIHDSLSATPLDDNPDETLLNDVLGYVRDSEAPQLREGQKGLLGKEKGVRNEPLIKDHCRFRYSSESIIKDHCRVRRM